MNTSRWIVVAIVTAALGFGAAWWLFGRDGDSAGGSGESDSGEREILYWVAPMDPNYRRDEPGKSPMGMDLVPVYADGEGAPDGPPALRIDPAVVNNIGVETATAERTDLPRTIESVARIVPNEYRLGHIHVRTEGWIEYLSVHTEGDLVERGDVLFRFYAPALVSAQREYVQSLAQGRPEIIEAAAERLLALGLQAQQVEQLEQTREVQRLVEFKAPHDGYVMELNVRHGMYVTPELMIMSIADLSSVWVEVDVFERQARWVEAGQAARMTLASAPGRAWQGEVDYVYPTIRRESRTARARLVFDNAELVFRPGMYASVRIDAAPREDVVAVPSSAVIRTGSGQRVILALGEGKFRPAQVETGLESDGHTEIVEGLDPGERIVVSSQFLIDSEASTDASLLRMIGDDDGDHDMEGMDHSDHDMEDMDHSDHDMDGMDHSAHDPNQGGDIQ